MHTEVKGKWGLTFIGRRGLHISGLRVIKKTVFSWYAFNLSGAEIGNDSLRKAHIQHWNWIHRGSPENKSAILMKGHTIHCNYTITNVFTWQFYMSREHAICSPRNTLSWHEGQLAIRSRVYVLDTDEQIQSILLKGTHREVKLVIRLGDGNQVAGALKPRWVVM